MPSSTDIHPHEGRSTPAAGLAVSQHRFMVPVVRPLPRPLVDVIIDARVW